MSIHDINLVFRQLVNGVEQFHSAHNFAHRYPPVIYMDDDDNVKFSGFAHSHDRSQGTCGLMHFCAVRTNSIQPVGGASAGAAHTMLEKSTCGVLGCCWCTCAAADSDKVQSNSKPSRRHCQHVPEGFACFWGNQSICTRQLSKHSCAIR